MRKLFILAFMILVSLSACCQTQTITGPTIIIAWDAPALGTIPVSQIAYEVVFQVYPSGAVTPVIGSVAITEEPVTFVVEGQYRIGVRTKRTIPGTPPVILYSEYTWSDIEGTPAPWYAAYFAVPPRVTKVRIK